MPSDIRLRLTIRRHGIPEVKLVWPCVASEDLTIAKLLNQVNDVVTLESGQWGFEDYAVELTDSSGDNFECLHYQRVGAVFKNDDQVLIRSLLTDDIKRRRLSGRHQISADGKHLVDGLAFGRPWLRTPGDRPPVTLPPRKRARITYDDDDFDVEEDEEEEEQETHGKLLLEEAQPLRIGRNGRLLLDSAEPLVRHLDNGTDDENDQDYVPGDAPKTGFLTGDNEDQDDEEEDLVYDGEDLEEEIRLLQADNEIIGEPPSLDVVDPPPQPPRNLIQEFIRAIEAPSDPVTMTALQAAFPLIPKTTIELQLKENEMDVRRTYRSLEASHTASLSYDELLDGCVTGRFEILAKIAEKEEAEAKAPARPLIQEVETIDNPPASVTKTHDKKKLVEDATSESSDDASSSDDSSSDSDTDSSDSDSDEEEDPSARHTGTVTFQSLSSDDESSSDESSDSDSDFGGGPLVEAIPETDTAFAALKARGGSSSESSSSSDSSSDDSDSSEDESSDDSSGTSKPEEASSKLAQVSSRPRIEVVESEPLIDPKQQTSVSSSMRPTEAGTVGHGLGRSKTQKRNARRKKRLAMKKLEEQNDTAQDITADTLNQELLAKKQALLIAVAEEATKPDDAEMTGMGDTGEHGDGETTAKETTSKPLNEQQTESPAVNPEAEESTNTKDSSATSQRRMRVDMGAGRRLLFGALGVKAPKSKADEETLKKDLMKDVRPLKNHRQLENGDAPPSGQGSNPANDIDDSPLDDSWKEKVTYRAVECCHENVVLSEPPFPFVQRWDPQQQYGSMRKRKRGSHNFTQDETYDDEEDEEYKYPEPSGARFGSAHKKPRIGKRQEKQASKMANINNADDIELNYDDPPIHARESSHPTEIEDLPPIPDDMSKLAILQRDMVKPGMVITWKQLSMSKSTNWQPQLASVAGVVLSVDERQRLKLMLAKRDREQAERLYDEETGQRIYDKFEMPDDSAEEEDAEDDGQRELAWNELMEPRIVQEAPSSPLSLHTAAEEASAAEQTVNAKSDTGSDSKPGISEAMELDQPQEDEELCVQRDQHMGDSSLPQSGQGVAHLEFSVPSLDPPTTNSDGSRAGASQSQHGDDQTIPGMLQQGKRPLIEVVPTDEKGPARLDEDSDDSSSDSDSSFQDAAPSLDVISASPNSDVADGAQQSDSGSSGSSPSIHSGRQPGTDLEVPDSMNHAGEENGYEPIIPDSNQEANEATSKAKASGDDSSSESSGVLPSIQEIWETAQTSKQTRSILEASQESTTVKVEHQETRQKLGGGEGDGITSRLQQSTTRRKLFPNASQPPTSKSLEDSPDLDNVKADGRSRRRQGKDFPGSSPGPVPSTSEEDGDGDVEDEVKAKVARINKSAGRSRKGKGGSKADHRRKSLPMATSLRVKKYSPQTGGRIVSVAGRRASKKI